MEVVLSCFDVTLWSTCLCQLVDHIGVLEVFRFMYNSRTGNAWIFLKLHEVVKTGVAFVLMLVELVLDLSLLWRLTEITGDSFIKKSHYLPIEVTLV